jgi:hypothetical protein
MKTLNYVLIFLISCSIISCNDTSIEQEMKEWCNCEIKALENILILDSCNQLMIDISKKYEFDPDAIPKIRKGVKECNN